MKFSLSHVVMTANLGLSLFLYSGSSVHAQPLMEESSSGGEYSLTARTTYAQAIPMPGVNMNEPEDMDLDPLDDPGESLIERAEDALQQIKPPGVDGDSQPGADVFYDADALDPSGEISKNAPRKVDPQSLPAKKLIIVRTSADKDSVTAKLVAAERALALGRYDAAYEFFNAIYAKNPKSSSALMGKAIALQKMGRIDEAINVYEKVLDIKPNHKYAEINMLGLISQKYPKAALNKLSDLYRDEPDNVPVIAQIAVAQTRLGNYKDAMKYLGIAASIEPRNANHLYNMAVVADKAGDKKTAISYYEQALEKDTIYGGGRTIPREQVFLRLTKLR